MSALKLQEFWDKCVLSLLTFRISCRLERQKVKGTSLLELSLQGRVLQAVVHGALWNWRAALFWKQMQKRQLAHSPKPVGPTERISETGLSSSFHLSEHCNNSTCIKLTDISHPALCSQLWGWCHQPAETNGLPGTTRALQGGKNSSANWKPPYGLYLEMGGHSDRKAGEGQGDMDRRG